MLVPAAVRSGFVTVNRALQERETNISQAKESNDSTVAGTKLFAPPTSLAFV